MRLIGGIAKGLLPLLIFLNLTIPLQICIADSYSPPFSYKKPSANGQFLFVMIAPVTAESELSADAQNIRATYRVSGLYLNNGSTVPLWTVDWYEPEVIVPSDGIHLIRQNTFPSSPSNRVLIFYANGRELRSYTVDELVDFKFLLPETISHFYWQEKAVLNDDERTLSLTTLNKDRYVFDITSGKILSSRRPTRMIIAVTVAVIIFLILLLVKRRSALSRTHNRGST
jgi:hypothetical protein